MEDDNYAFFDVTAEMPPRIAKKYTEAVQILGRLGVVGPPTRLGDWRTHANCKDMGTKLFLPAADLWRPDRDSDQISQAKAICRKCPVAGDCLEFAYRTNDRTSILAATIPDERAHPEKLLPELSE